MVAVAVDIDILCVIRRETSEEEEEEEPKL